MRQYHWGVPRQILVLTLAAAACAAAQSSPPPSAREIIGRIKAHVGVAWREQTVDTFKAGDPDTPVTGIATTMMATFDVLQRAAAEGKNLVITHEPVFYSHLDNTDTLEAGNDAVWAEKMKFIASHKMVVWRFHDHWHMRQPDGIMEGVLRPLDWEKQYNPATRLITIQPTTVGELAAYVRRKLNAKVLRVVGNRDMRVTTIALQPGAAGPTAHRSALQRNEVEVLLIGEVPEWETIEYVSDAVAQGKRKALFLIGHIPSEQPGMANCAEWLKTFITGVPVGFVPAREPFWTAE